MFKTIFNHELSPAHTHYRIINKYYPPIFLLGVNSTIESPISLASFDDILNKLPPTLFVFNPMWSLSVKTFREPVFKRLLEIHAQHPRHSYVFLVNDQNDLKYTDDLPTSIPVYVCGEHSAVDVEIFSRHPFCKPEYSSVIVSRPHPYKRIHLARKIESLAVIASGLDATNFKFMTEAVPKGKFLNHNNEKFIRLEPSQVADVFSKSRTGLILSACEGSNRATIEYLLAGLPVVSTANVGGRDRFLNPSNCVYAKSDPDSISAAVSYLCKSNYDRETIRRESIEYVYREKSYLIHIINNELSKMGFSPIQQEEIKIPHHGFSIINFVGELMDKLNYSI